MILFIAVIVVQMQALQCKVYTAYFTLPTLYCLLCTDDFIAQTLPFKDETSPQWS